MLRYGLKMWQTRPHDEAAVAVAGVGAGSFRSSLKRRRILGRDAGIAERQRAGRAEEQDQLAVHAADGAETSLAPGMPSSEVIASCNPSKA